MEFLNRVAVVTGGARGIGRAIARSFYEQGAQIAVMDMDKEAGAQVYGSMPAQRVFFFCGDVGEQRDLERFAGQVVQKFGRVDALVHNACLSRQGILSGCSHQDFQYVLNVGVTAPYYLTRLLLKAMPKGASVVHIASTRAEMSQADTESYSAAKGGIRALTHALSVSLAGHVRVNSISPGWIDTGAYQGEEGYVYSHSRQDASQHPAGRVGRPEDIAEMALFLSSGRAGFITGENITIDGGMTKRMIYHGDEGWSFSGQERE